MVWVDSPLFSLDGRGLLNRYLCYSKNQYQHIVYLYRKKVFTDPTVQIKHLWTVRSLSYIYHHGEDIDRDKYIRYNKKATGWTNFVQVNYANYQATNKILKYPRGPEWFDKSPLVNWTDFWWWGDKSDINEFYLCLGTPNIQYYEARLNNIILNEWEDDKIINSYHFPYWVAEFKKYSWQPFYVYFVIVNPFRPPLKPNYTTEYRVEFQNKSGADINPGWKVVVNHEARTVSNVQI